MISGSSVLSALAIYTLALLLLSLLRLSTHFIGAGGDSVILAASALITVRLFLPIEIPVTSIVESWDFLGPIQRYLRDNPEIIRPLLIIWGVGAVLAVGWDVYILARSRKICSEYATVESPQVDEAVKELDIPCPVIVSPDVPVPYVAGLLQHTIYLPAWNFSEKELRMTLSHERYHVLAHDALIKVFFGFMSALMWWNPLIHIFRHVVDALLEFRCDRRVVKDLSPMERVEYGTMLLNMATRRTKKSRVPAMAVDEFSALGLPNTLQQRIEILTVQENKRARWAVTAIGCLCALVLFCASYLVVFQPAIILPVDEFENEPEVYYYEDLEGLEADEGSHNMFILKNSDGRYQLFIDYHFIEYLSYEEVTSDKYQNLRIFEENQQK